MWNARTDPVDSGVRLRFYDGDEPLSFDALLHLLDSSDDFALWYGNTLSHNGSEAFFWEHPALTNDRLDDVSECVLIDSRSLAGLRADPTPFARHFREAQGQDVISFRNLGGDAQLVVPCPVGPSGAYPHLAAFLRQGPSTQVASLWSAVARAVQGNVADTPLWLSTSGLGVAWLHVRLDSRPKYYQHEPYKSH